LLDLDAQYVFLVPEHTKGTALSVRRLPEHPAWKMIPAVRNGRVWELKTHSQWLVAGVLGKARIIDEVLRAVAPESVEAVNARADAFLAGGRD
jgi:ABC-type Fe3+-hydroxamate transport system substrate-binding protein